MRIGTSGRRRRAWFGCLVGGLVLWTVLAGAIDQGLFGVLQDDGIYLSAARSLRDGRGFGLPGRPGEPPPKYPIGLPLALACALRLDPRPPTLAHEVTAARAVILLGGWAFFLATHAWLRRVGVGPALATAIVLGTAFHPVVLIGGAATVFADLPFAAVAFTLFARLAANRGRRRGPPGLPELVDGLLAGCGCLLRSNGLTLIVAALAAAATRRVDPGDRSGRRRSIVGCLLGVLVLVGPLTWYAGRHPRVVPSNHYLLELRAGWATPGAGLRLVARNLTAVITEFPAHVVGSSVATVDPNRARSAADQLADRWFRGVVAAIMAVGLVGLIRRSRRCDLPVWLHAAGTVAAFAIWPWTGIMDRFLITLVPLTLLAFVRGVEGLMGLLPALKGDRGGSGRLALWGLAAVVASNGAVVGRSVNLFRERDGQWPATPDRVDQERACHLIQAWTAPEAVIASAWPELISLQTGRTAVPIFEDEAVLTGRFGDISALNRWRALTLGRPFYLLHRSRQQDSGGSDDAQLAALTGPGSRLALEPVAQTPGGHHRISRLIELPDPNADRAR